MEALQFTHSIRYREILLHLINIFVYSFLFFQAKITHHTIPQNVQLFNIESIISGVLPQQLYCFMVEEESFSGKLEKNPYHFQSFGLNRYFFKVGFCCMVFIFL